MSTAVAEPVSLAPSARYFLLRRLHSLTGILFGGYLCVHLMINATLIEGQREGASVFFTQVSKIHSLPFLLGIEWACIYLPMLFHAVYGIWVALAGQPNNAAYTYKNNWHYLAQRLSTIIIVLFMVVHVLGFKGLLGQSLAFHVSDDSKVMLGSVYKHFGTSWWLLYVLYPLGVLASCYHTANGFRGAAIAWGLTVSDASMKRWNAVCIAIFVGMTVLGFTALVAIAGQMQH